MNDESRKHLAASLRDLAALVDSGDVSAVVVAAVTNVVRVQYGGDYPSVLAATFAAHAEVSALAVRVSKDQDDQEAPESP